MGQGLWNLNPPPKKNKPTGFGLSCRHAAGGGASVRLGSRCCVSALGPWDRPICAGRNARAGSLLRKWHENTAVLSPQRLADSPLPAPRCPRSECSPCRGSSPCCCPPSSTRSCRTPNCPELRSLKWVCCCECDDRDARSWRRWRHRCLGGARRVWWCVRLHGCETRACNRLQPASHNPLVMPRSMQLKQ